MEEFSTSRVQAETKKDQYLEILKRNMILDDLRI